MPKNLMPIDHITANFDTTAYIDDEFVVVELYYKTLIV